VGCQQSGLNCPPLETPDGWLILYHGVRQTASGSIYRLGLALLDLENPSKVLRRSDEWYLDRRSFMKEKETLMMWCSPADGFIMKDREIKIYYGAADTCIAMATTNISDLLDYIKRCPEPK